LKPEHAEPMLTACGPCGVAMVNSVPSSGETVAPRGRTALNPPVAHAVASATNGSRWPRRNVYGTGQTRKA
jgi:hypothetical protein